MNSDNFRPHYHFTPPRDWMNDPNGLVFFRGQWHLFYQWQPAEATGKWWGHAVSDDLVNWQHLPAALEEDELGAIWSGSCVVDENDSSGFFNGEAGLVAIFTHQTAEYQVQSLAYSRDGFTWTKFDGNPVLRSEKHDFRDPKVFWHEATRRWVMVLATGDCVSFYTSPNLRDWLYVSSFGADKDAKGKVWECPDLFPLNDKWVLLASRIGPESFERDENGKRGFGACITYYFIGDFDGENFVSETAPLTLGGPDDYAAVSWSNAPDGRSIIIGWMNHWGYAGDVPTKSEGWQGAMTLPRELALRHGTNGPQLLHNPVREIESLRGARYGIESQLISPEETGELDFHSDCCEIIAEFELGAARECGLCVCAGGSEATLIGYDAVKKGIYLDRTHAGKSDFHPRFAGRYTAPLKLENGLLKLRVFVDRSSVEVFANDGAACLSAQIFPSRESCGIAVFAAGATCLLRAFECYELLPK